MREKKVTNATMQRYQDFLDMVKENALPYECQKSLSSIAFTNSVTKAAPKALEELGIIKREGKFWHWLKGAPSKKMVFEVLDFNLKKTKKTVHFPIPELAGVGDALKEITERLMQITVQHERAFKSVKNNHGETQAINPTIFTEQQQRFEMVKAITAGGAFKNWQDLTDYKETISIHIIETADYIIELLNRPKP